MNRAHRARIAVTIIELLMATLVIAALMGLLLPGLSLVRHKAHQTEARQTTNELVVALDLYRRDEPRHRYPTEAADVSIGRVLMEDLDRRGLWSWGSRQLDDDGRLLDPWGIPYRYTQTRPAPSAGVETMLDWNWDRTAGREARWGVRRRDDGSVGEGPLPFPYVWSLGRSGSSTDATSWIFTLDGK